MASGIQLNSCFPQGPPACSVCLGLLTRQPLPTLNKWILGTLVGSQILTDVSLQKHAGPTSLENLKWMMFFLVLQTFSTLFIYSFYSNPYEGLRWAWIQNNILYYNRDVLGDLKMCLFVFLFFSQLLECSNGLGAVDYSSGWILFWHPIVI